MTRPLAALLGGTASPYRPWRPYRVRPVRTRVGQDETPRSAGVVASANAGSNSRVAPCFRRSMSVCTRSQVVFSTCYTNVALPSIPCTFVHADAVSSFPFSVRKHMAAVKNVVLALKTMSYHLCMRARAHCYYPKCTYVHVRSMQSAYTVEENTKD